VRPVSGPSPAIEIVRAEFRPGRIRAVLFDFDGTLSLIRRNWQAVMIPMMVDELLATGTDESPASLATHVEDYVMRLNGKQTIYQMMQLADEVRQRGGVPREPLEYKHRYHELLWVQIGTRVAALTDGTATPEEHSVPDTHAFLSALAARGIPLYLASGTDLKYVQDEAAALRLTQFFAGRIYGALDNYRDFSKALVIERLLAETGLDGGELLAFGDGYVEIQETRKVGGVAVGVASEEETRQGVNGWKRARLIGAGADLIIGDYRCRDELLDTLGL